MCKQSCTKHVAAASEALCLEAAIQACSNDRLDYAKRDAEFNQCAKKK